MLNEAPRMPAACDRSRCWERDVGRARHWHRHARPARHGHHWWPASWLRHDHTEAYAVRRWAVRRQVCLARVRQVL